MSKLAMAPPYSPIEPVTEVLHGVTVTDPYRWLEDQNSPRTREWLLAQHEYARSYLDGIPGRDRIRARIRELVDIETYDSIQKVGQRYFFRKRRPGQEQPCIFLRERTQDGDRLLVDPADRGTGPYTAVKPLRVSSDGSLLLYEVKDGGERTGTFELLDIESRRILPDSLPRGYLRGFAFAPGSKAFYYVHEAEDSTLGRRVAVFRHVLGEQFNDDQQIFSVGSGEKLRLLIVPGKERLGLLLFRFLDKTHTDLYLWPLQGNPSLEFVVQDAEYLFSPLLLDDGRILALTDYKSPNFRIVDVRPRAGQEPEFADLVPEADAVIQNWVLAGECIFVSYFRELQTQVDIFDLSGKHLGQLPVESSSTVRLLGGFTDSDELFFEQESFTKPTQILSYSPKDHRVSLWAERIVSFDPANFGQVQLWFTGRDGVRIPIFLVGRRDLIEKGCHPTIMTSYGGYGVPMTPQFSALVAFLLERGCLFALPNIRGGSEFGVEWHNAAKRRNRQVAIDDFLSAAAWLIETGLTEPQKLAIFGGSNSGLLVGAALTQRPELFRAVLSMVPMLDMLRYHLFDQAHIWTEEFGTAADSSDFAALLSYSPYHNVRDGVDYPATMIVSGDSDQNCNPLHARKMIARLQAANVSENPIFLDYCRYRGHSPVLPLSMRIEALTDRLAFLCNQLELNF